ncbi:MAG: hypothetical protein JNK53_01320 [Phycisphaerae bacterium]|nr:hypothetical protein [Phycisphaerae bacterium]
MNRNMAAILASLAGLLMVASAFFTSTQGLGETAVDWFNILAAIAFVLGGASLTKMNLARMSARTPGWGYSAVTLLAFAITLGVGLLKVGVPPSDLSPNVLMSGEKDFEGSAFWWIYEYVMSPITSTLFALLAFYVASAAFRAFRAKNTEAFLLLGTAFIVLLGRVYAGVVLTSWISETNPWVSWLRFENLSGLIMSVFNTAGTRAMIIGIAIGVSATSLKIMLGLDRSYLGNGE